MSHYITPLSIQKCYYYVLCKEIVLYSALENPQLDAEDFLRDPSFF